MIDTRVAPKGDRGRPRSGTSDRPDLTATEQILDAAAQLFVERGYAATSTRAIAELVGIRQASLYYHFSSKEEILRLLLLRTVEPSMRVANYLATAPGEAAPRLYALISFDARQLFAVPHNIGTLYFVPETRNEPFETFRQERARLRSVYATLIASSISPDVMEAFDRRPGGDYLVEVVFGLVESVISIRADRTTDDPLPLVEIIAESCLRALGHDTASIADISAAAAALGEPWAAS